MCIPSVLVLKTIGNVSVVETETKEEATVGGGLCDPPSTWGPGRQPRGSDHF